MNEYIKRADAINAFWEDSDIRTAEVRATLKALPSADAVPFDIQLQSTREVLDQFAEDRVKVVRCENCRYFTHYADGCGVCSEKDHILTYQNQNDFCSHGERAEQTEHKEANE